MATRISNPIHQHFTKGSTGPLSRGQLFFYEPGTTTKKTVYSDQDASTAYSDNPIALDDNGFEPDIFGSGSYRVILKSSVDTNSRIQWDEPVVFSGDEDAFAPWLDTKTYGAGGDNIVTGPDDKYYVSIQASNLDNIPSSSATYWTEFDLLKRWNLNEAYAIDDPVTHNGDYYISLTSSNSGNTPSSSAFDWRKAAEGGAAFATWISSKTYGSGDDNIVSASDGKYYVSIQGSNLNQDPNAGGAPTFWTEFSLLKQWNTNETYVIDNPVTDSGGYYLSLVNSNIGNTPSSSPTQWRRMSALVTVQTFTASGTWTKPSGVKQIIIEVIGGGGGGGGNESGGGGGSLGSGSGGGGGYARITIDSTSLSSETVTVGAGGLGGGVDADGTAGGPSSLGALCVATGGLGGFHVANGREAVLGGIGTTGDMLSSGGAGGIALDFSSGRSTTGGNSAFGSGGGQVSTITDDGQNGRSYGGGGGGAVGTGDGGAGADGFVIITEFS